VDWARTCLNYAILLHEKDAPDKANILEEALSLCHESINILRRLKADEQTRPLGEFTSADEILSSALQTNANILRERVYGDPRENLERARDLLLEAIDLVSRQLNPQLYGIIRLNLGHVYMDLQEIIRLPYPGLFTNALYCYEEALEVLSDYPEARAVALRDTAAILMDLGRSGEIDAWATAEQRLEEAREIFIQLNDLGAAGWVHQNLGVLFRERPDVPPETCKQKVVEHFEAAARLSQEGQRPLAAIRAYRSLADSYVSSFLSTHDRSEAERGEMVLSRAASIVETIWSRLREIDAQHAFSLDYAWTYNELAWIKAQLGRPPEEIWWSISKGKSRQLREHLGVLLQTRDAIPHHLSERFHILWHKLRVLQTVKWKDAVSGVNTDRVVFREPSLRSALADAIRDFEEVKSHLSPYYETEFDNPATLRSEAVDRLPVIVNAVVLDIAVCRWGTITVALSVVDGTVSWPPGVSTSPLTLDDLSVLLWGRGDGIGWYETYFLYRNTADVHKAAARSAWATATDLLLDSLGQVWAWPLSRLISHPVKEKAALIILGGGPLISVPLHAARLSYDPISYLYEQFAGLCYCPSLRLLTGTPMKWAPPDTALLVLSDPETDPRQQLLGARTELVHAAYALVTGGTRVTVVAALGEKIGTEVFRESSVPLPAGTVIVDVLPTRQWLQDHLGKYEHIFFAGHGKFAPSGDQTGLVLPAPGYEQTELFSLDAILQMPVLGMRPSVYLSACETATPELWDTGAEYMTLAGAFLRTGASWVCGSLWSLATGYAVLFSEAFYGGLAADLTPTQAVTMAISALRRSSLEIGIKAEELGVPTDHPIFWAGIISFGWPL